MRKPEGEIGWQTDCPICGTWNWVDMRKPHKTACGRCNWQIRLTLDEIRRIRDPMEREDRRVMI